MAERLERYAPPPAELDLDSWVTTLQQLTGACAHYDPHHDSAILSALADLESWVEEAAPVVRHRFPHLPHGDVLRLIPQNLRGSLQLCQMIQSKDTNRDWVRYKTTRDSLAAAYAVQLKSAVGRLVIWAHVSHLQYDATGRNTSVGSELRRALGRQLYTVAAFAGGGGTVVLFSDVNELIGYDVIHSISPELQKRIANACRSDCFVEIGSADDSVFMNSQRVWIESGPTLMALGQNFDGILWIQRIHAPDFPVLKLLALASWAYAKPPRLYYSMSLIIMVAAVVVGAHLTHRRRDALRARL